MKENLSILIGLLIVAVIIIGLIKNLKELRKIGKSCDQCGEKYKLKHLKDPMGAKIKPKITISFYQGPRNILKLGYA